MPDVWDHLPTGTSHVILGLHPVDQATHWHDMWQTVPIPDQRRAAFLPGLVRAGRAAVPPALATLTCSRGNPARPCADQPVPGHLVPTQGGILFPVMQCNATQAK